MNYKVLVMKFVTGTCEKDLSFFLLCLFYDEIHAVKIIKVFHLPNLPRNKCCKVTYISHLPSPLQNQPVKISTFSHLPCPPNSYCKTCSEGNPPKANGIRELQENTQIPLKRARIDAPQ